MVVDDEDRENEGDLIIAADAITTEKMAFMIRQTSGVILFPDVRRACRRPRPAPHGGRQHRVDAHGVHGLGGPGEGTTTGISAHDRSLTVNALADPDRSGVSSPVRATSSPCVQGPVVC